MWKRFVSSSLAIVTGLATVSVAQEDYSQWSFRKTITVNTTSTGINVSQNVAKYPLLVRLGAAEATIFAQAGTNGASLRFTKADGSTRLPHSIDHWDPVGQSAAIWVLADTVYGNNAQGVNMRMFWGKVGAPDSSKPGAVFDTANGFRAVWHLNETASPALDATPLGTDAVWMNSPASAAGNIGNAINIANPNGTSSADGKYLRAAYNAVNENFRTNSVDGLTLSAWVNRTSNNGQANQGIAGRWNWSGGERRQSILEANATSWQFAVSPTGRGNNEVTVGDVPVVNGDWAHVVATYRNGSQTLYVNGVADTTLTMAVTGLDSVWAAAPFLIGRMETNGCCLQGIDARIDEVRLSDTTRSAAWIALDYSTQMPASAAVAMSATDTLNPFVIISELRYQSGNTDAIDTLRYSAFSAVNVTPTYVGQVPDSFTVAGTLPAGVTFNEATGAINGTVTTTSSAELTFTAHVDAETASRVVRLIVTPGIANLRYVPGNTASRDTLMMSTGAAVNLVPQYDGGPADSIKLTGNTVTIPAGLTLNKTTGAITGTPTATFTGNRTVTAYFGSQTTVRDIRLVVTLGPTSAFTYSGESFTLNAGESFVGATPTWAGRAPTAFTATPALPAGLALNPLTGVISGTPTAAASNLSVTIRATNATDTVTKALTFTVAAATADGAYATAWSRHATLKLNTTATGANVTTTVAKFPVLVRLGASDTAVFSAAHTTGRDIRFTKMDNTTRLPHQIDHWDNAGKSAAVWVLVDSVIGNNNTQSIRMHWGNASASPLSNGNAVFDTANGFVAVWHLGGGNETAVRGNAVAGGNPAVPEFFPTGYVAPRGVIGSADTLRGGTQAAGDRLNLGRGYGNWGGAMTMSMWIKPHAVDLGQWNQYMSLSNGQAQDNIWMGRQGNNQNFTTEIYSGTQSGGHAHAADVQVQGEWQLLSWTVANGTDVTLYRNGGEVLTRASTQPLKDTLRIVNHIGRAAWPDPTIEAVVDEARLSKVARSASWIKLEFENQKPTQSLVSITLDSVPVSLAGSVLAGEALSFRAVQNGVMFNLRTDKASNARIEVIDMRGRAVWSRSLKTTSGLNQVLWSGRSEQGAGSGVYFVRMLLLDENNVPTHRLERKLPLAR